MHLGRAMEVLGHRDEMGNMGQLGDSAQAQVISSLFFYILFPIWHSYFISNSNMRSGYQLEFIYTIQNL
jgi:hypothetical protein